MLACTCFGIACAIKVGALFRMGKTSANVVTGRGVFTFQSFHLILKYSSSGLLVVSAGAGAGKLANLRQEGL